MSCFVRQDSSGRLALRALLMDVLGDSVTLLERDVLHTDGDHTDVVRLNCVYGVAVTRPQKVIACCIFNVQPTACVGYSMPSGNVEFSRGADSSAVAENNLLEVEVTFVGGTSAKPQYCRWQETSYFRAQRKCFQEPKSKEGLLTFTRSHLSSLVFESESKTSTKCQVVLIDYGNKKLWISHLCSTLTYGFP